ncbi:MAG: polyprenyl synthetase family protein [Anaerohalosphaeraceae bacterium]|nr:polyprenyl synthetase family protein [Anaerohalosphaeraceae bacterium]
MTVESGKIDVKAVLVDRAERIDAVLADILASGAPIPKSLAEAISYTLIAPGKRIRPAVTLCVCQMLSGEICADAETAAAAIEMVHTYSLIHDDLPAMDDDDFRRGRASCHKAFDEATAILAGDSLLTLAFEIMAERISLPGKAVELIKILAAAAGPSGMIAGQVADIEAEKSRGNEDALKYIHINKTARMFQAATLCGAVAAGASEGDKKLLADFGLNLGLCFQIADDILDVSASTAELGKTAGKDAAAGKLTYPSLFGLAESKKIAAGIAEKAMAVIEPFGEKANVLIALTENLINRTR